MAAQVTKVLKQITKGIAGFGGKEKTMVYTTKADPAAIELGRRAKHMMVGQNLPENMRGQVRGITISKSKSIGVDEEGNAVERVSHGTSYNYEVPTKTIVEVDEGTTIFGKTLGPAVGYAARGLSTFLDWIRSGIQSFLLVSGFVMFKDFICEETVQTAQFGNFVTLKELKSLLFSLRNNLVALEIALSLRKLMWWNFNQAAFDGFFNVAINTYKSYLLHLATALQPEVPFNIKATYKGEPMEVGIYWWDDFSYLYTPEETIKRITPTMNNKFKIKFRQKGFIDIDKIIEIRPVEGLDSFNMQEKIYSHLEEELLFKFKKQSSINETSYKYPGAGLTSPAQIAVEKVITKHTSTDPEFIWTDYLDEGDLHPHLISKLRQHVYETKAKTIKNQYTFTYWDTDKEQNISELTCLGEVDEFFDNLGYSIDQNTLFLFTQDLVRQVNLTKEYVKANMIKRISKDMPNEVISDTNVDKIISIINNRSIITRLADDTELSYSNWGTYIGSRKYPYVYHSIKEGILGSQLEFNNEKPIIKNEWTFSFGTHSYFIRELKEDNDNLYLYRSLKLGDIINPDQVWNILQVNRGQFQWRDITGKSIEWLEENPEDTEEVKWKTTTQIFLEVEMQKFTDEPMFKMSDVDGVDKDKFIKFLIDNIGVDWVDNTATFTYKKG